LTNMGHGSTIIMLWVQELINCSDGSVFSSSCFKKKLALENALARADSLTLSVKPSLTSGELVKLAIELLPLTICYPLSESRFCDC